MRTLLTLVVKAQNPTTYRWTDSPESAAPGGLEFEPAAWDWSGLDLSNEDTAGTTQVRVAATNPAAAALLQGTPATVWIQEMDDDGAVWTAFKGKVAGCELDADVLTLKAAAAGLTTAQIVPARAYSAYCQHPTYGAGCGLNRDDWTAAATVLAAVGTTLTLAPAAAEFPSGRAFDSGMLQWSAVIAADGSAGLITAATGWMVETDSPLQLYPGDVVRVRAGCNKLRQGHCVERFNNAANCSATDLIPATNPFTQSLK